MLAYAEPGTDNMLAGLQTGTSYAQLSRDMSPAMLPAMTESQCSSLCTLLDTNVGAYVSRQVSGVEENDDFITVVYDARYQNKDRVTGPIVYVRFHGAGPRYSGRYSVEDLNIWTGLLRDLAAGTAHGTGEGARRRVYVYFNNDADGHAVANALELRAMLRAP